MGGGPSRDGFRTRTSTTRELADEGDESGGRPAAGRPPCARRLRSLARAFVATSREEVDEFSRAGTDAGYVSDGAPGLRPQYHDDNHGSFLLDS